MKRLKEKAILVTFLHLAIFGFPSFAKDLPPVTKAEMTVDDYFGVKVADPYRWLETNNEESKKWMEAQRQFATKVLNSIPGRKQLRDEIYKLRDSVDVVEYAENHNGKYFYFKTLKGEQTKKLYMREGLQGKEVMLIDPVVFAGRGSRLDGYYASPSGRYAGFSTSKNGAENSVVRIIDTQTLKVFPEVFERMQYAQIYWLSDDQFFYNRPPKLSPTAMSVETYRRDTAYLHKLGNKVSQDKPILGYGFKVLSSNSPDDFHWVVPAGDYVVGVVAHGILEDLDLYVVRSEELKQKVVPWKKIASVDDQITEFAADSSGKLFLLSHKDAARYKLLRIDDPLIDSTAVEVMKEGEAVLSGICGAREAVYFTGLDGGRTRIYRLLNGSSRVEEVDLGEEPKTVRWLVCNHDTQGAVWRQESWLHSPKWAFVDNRRAEDTGLVKPHPADFSNYAVEEVMVKSKDGTEVPLSIVHKKSMLFDGSNPTWLRAYGAYGVPLRPLFQPEKLAWLERGGVIAVAHVRGGGEYGDTWHRQGSRKNKQNSVDDFIASAEYLIGKKYTSPKNLGAEGGSAGGVTIGMAIVQKPELFKAALLLVSVLNPMRNDKTQTGVLGDDEFGNSQSKEGFEVLLHQDPYLNAEKKKWYPATLLTAGANDPRVPVWQPAKFTARLQKNSLSNLPILLRLDPEGGHSVEFAASKNQQVEELVDQQAFLLWQLKGNLGRSIATPANKLAERSIK
jgi:prolyl oligopeptidase